MDANRVNITVTATDKGATAVLKDVDQTVKKTTSTWGALGKSVGAVAGGLGIAAAAAKIFGATIGAGFNRLGDLEDANKRLRQMGLNLEEVNALSAELNSILRGTPFALNEGANAMTKLVSAGISLKNVPTYFKDIVDAAAFSQSPIEDVADIFVKIQSEGKVTSERLNQLTARGIPAFTLLASAIGISGDQLRVMLKTGSLDSDTFFQAWHKGAQGFGKDNIVMAGAAQSMGDTTRGALSNAATALARLGANLLEEVWPAFRKVADGTREVADGLGKVVDYFQENDAAGAALAGVVSGLAAKYVVMAGAAVVSGVQAVASFVSMAVAAFAADAATLGLGATMRGLMGAMGPVGIAFAVIGGAMAYFVNSSGHADKANDQLVKSLDEASGALTENSREIVYNALVKSGAVENAKAMGIGLDDLTDAALGNADATRKVSDAIAAYSKANEYAYQGNEKVMTTSDAVKRRVSDLSDAVFGQNEEVTKATAAWKDQQAALGDTKVATEEVKTATEEETKAAKDAQDKLDKWRESVENSAASFIDMGGAMSDAIQQNKDYAQSTADATKSSDDSWQTYYDGVTVSVDEYIAQLQAQVEAQKNWETNMVDIANRVGDGMSGSMRDAGIEMINELMKLGPEGAAQVALLRNMSDAEFVNVVSLYRDSGIKADAAFRDAIETALPPTITPVANMQPAINSFGDYLNYVKNNGPTITAYGVTGKGHAAEGGPRSGMTLVGENGPEVLNLAAGTHVTPAGGTQQAMSQQGGGGVVQVMFGSDGSQLGDLILALVRNTVRVRGGNVQTVLGA